MKAYVITTGVIFVLLTVLHVWRATVERELATKPWFIVLTLSTAVLSLWAWRLLRRDLRS
jgi:predicted cation transporter